MMATYGACAAPIRKRLRCARRGRPEERARSALAATTR